MQARLRSSLPIALASALLALALVPLAGIPRSAALAREAGPASAAVVINAKPAPDKTSRGYDVSYPQCGAAYPANPLFGIVGVNGGRVFSANPCLASQVTWAGGAKASLYANTGNPGPGLSTHWPSGQTSPRFCDPANLDTADCAYDYGWNAAADSFATARSAFSAAGVAASPASVSWWLDVETTNSWRTDVSLNVAALQGEVAALQSLGVTAIGFYSTTVQWGTITGSTRVFAAYPAWGAGSSSEKVARSHCTSTPGFTGGRLAVVQYPYQGWDADLLC